MIKPVETSPVKSVNEDVIRVLSEVLEQAKAGDVVDVAYAFIQVNGVTGYNYSYGPNKHSALIGALFETQQSILSSVENEK